ncbi:MAG: hypothetical protein IKW03_07305 [Clostridia bacterium]|nr:hypothetical protein [Clostridia bacterium]
MNYNNIDCPVCGIKFNENDDVVVCPICGTPHHRNCWNETGRCINEEKHAEGFVWQMINTEPSFTKKADDNTKICPRCGTKNDSFEPVCTNCGERLKANRQTINDTFNPFGAPPQGDWQAEVNPNAFSPYQNMYAQDAKTVFGDDTTIDDIPVSEVAEYIQKDSTKYIGKMLTIQNNKTKISWNWSAALGSCFWFFYRKMTGAGTIFMCIFLLVSFGAGILVPAVCKLVNPEMYNEYAALATELLAVMTEYVESGAVSAPAEYYDIMFKMMMSPVVIATSIVNVAAVLIISVVSGFFGNYLYKKKVVKDITTLRQVAVNSVAYHMYLRQRGNVSVINLLLPIMLYMMYTMLTSYI